MKHDESRNVMNELTKTPSVNRRFFSNTAINYAGQAFVIVLTFATAPYTVHHLGPELYGILALVQVVAGFAGLLNLGIGRALTKYVSELFWKGDFGEINRLFETAWATCLMAGVMSFVVLAAPKGVIGRLFFRGGPEVRAVVGFAIYIAAFGLFTSMLLESVSGLPVALQRFDIVNVVNVIVGTVRCVGPVVVLALGYGIRAVLAITLAGNLLALAAFAIVSMKLIPGLSLAPKFSRTAFKKLFSFSLPLLLSALFALLVTRADRLILAYYLPLAAVTFYTLPYSISQKASLGVANITAVVFPFTSELHSRGVQDKVHELYLRSTKILMLVTMPLITILIAVPGPILRYWLGPEYAAEGATALVLLAIATLLNALSAVPTVTSLGVGEAWIPAAFAFGSSVVNLTSNFLLIPRFGINGAAIASVLGEGLVTPIFVCVVTRMIQVPFWELFTQGIVRPLVCASVQFAVLLAFRRYADSLLGLATLCVASLAIFAFVSLFGAITQEERSALFRLSMLQFGER